MDALNWGKGIGETLTGAFSGAESAFRSFVETGKFDVKGLVRSILADLAVLSFKRPERSRSDRFGRIT